MLGNNNKTNKQKKTTTTKQYGSVTKQTIIKLKKIKEMLHRYVDTYFNGNLNNSKYFKKNNPNKTFNN